MSNPRRFAALLAAAVALAPCATDAAADREERASIIAEAKGIAFSGYDRDAAGRRRWALDAASAKPADKPGKRWQLDTLKLRTFDKSGAVDLRMAAPSATFDSESHRASDPGAVTLEGARISLTGTNWTWAHAGNTEVFEIKGGVHVTLRPPADKENKEPSVLEARTLRLEHTPAGDTLTFTGEVRITRAGATLGADTLTTVLKTDRRAGGSFAAASADKSAVEQITASGSVNIRHGNALITGARAEVTPASGLYAVTGDAEFQDLGERRIRVRGETIRYDAPANRITVAPDDDGRVHAELPSLDSAHDATDETRARAASDSLFVVLSKSAATLVMKGSVTIDDPQNRLRCGRLEVETPHADHGATGAAPLAAVRGVRRVIAEDTVELIRDRRTLRCGRVEMTPPNHRAVLTGAPRGEDAATGATLEADRMTLDSAEKTLFAEAGTNRPVRVTMPASALDRKARSDAAPVALEAGLLLATRPTESAAVFKFEDRVTLEGDALSGGCDRLGIEITHAKPGAENHTPARIRRIEANGGVRLRQSAYAAEADHAEILPAPTLTELSVKEDNGLDGKSPFVVTLDVPPSDDPDAPRTKVTLPPMAIPRLESGVAPEITAAEAKAAPVTVEARRQQLVVGRERLRAFASETVRVTSADFSGTCDSLEALATAVKSPAAPGRRPEFEADAIVARGAVRMKLGERTAAADTLEILPRDRRIALTGHPSLTGWVTAPGTAKKTVSWETSAGADGKPTTRIRLRDEAEAGMPEQILRPKIVIPAEIAPDLGRSLRKTINR